MNLPLRMTGCSGLSVVEAIIAKLHNEAKSTSETVKKETPVAMHTLYNINDCTLHQCTMNCRVVELESNE